MHASIRASMVVVAAAAALTAGAGQAGDTSTAAATTASLGPASRSFRFTYSVKVRDIPAGAQHVAIWVPVPKTDRHQVVRDVDVKTALDYHIENDRQYGNSILHLRADKPLPPEIDLELQAVVERTAYSVLASKAAAEDAQPSKRDLQPDRLVPIDGKIGTIAATVTKGAKTPLEKARAIYDYVTAELKYDKSGQGWGRGDAIYACDVRRGNCTDFHSLIIGMARASGIPARFVIGFPLPSDKPAGDIGGYHCWAELFIKGIGWLPVDSSEASKHPEMREAFFGGLDANRIELTTGRDLDLVPKASEPLNYFVYPYVEVDGKPFTTVDRHFSFADVGS